MAQRSSAEREALRGELRERVRDPHWYVPRMGIVDKDGVATTLRRMTPEQRVVLEALVAFNNVCILKPRQIGCTTIVVAFMYWWSLFSANEFNWLTIAHEDKAAARVNQFLRNYWRTTPAAWRPTLKPDNARLLGFTHNNSMFMQTMAGGRGQGKSYTFQGIHATEQGMWPRGSSAREGSAVDEDIWASVLSTVARGPHTRRVVESTAYGPAGIYYKNVQTARESADWCFLFFAWFDFAEYQIEPPYDWERRDDEQELADLYDLNDGQLAWRRMKIEDENYGLERFRKDFPCNWQEPFLLSGGTWFNGEHLNQMLALIDRKWLNHTDDLAIFHEREHGRTYYMGGDPAGGTGGDEAVWIVLRDDAVVVARYASRKVGPIPFADIGVRLSTRYNRARILCESNAFGKATLRRLRQMHARIWTDPKGKDFWTDPRTKVMVYDYGRFCVDGDYVVILDPETIHQMMHVRQQRNGDIGGDEGYNDDRPMALMLAIWNARTHYDYQARPMSYHARVKRAREQRHKELGLDDKRG